MRQLIIGSIIAAAMSCHAQQVAIITVDASATEGPVNRLIFGQNIEAGDTAGIFNDSTDMNTIRTGNGFWDPTKSVPVPSILAQSKVVRMGVLRYPGGCLVHNFDWRKTVGPDAKKKGWLFGVDEYLALSRAIGAEPMITISDYALPADQMPGNAAALVEYLNGPPDAGHPWAMKRKAGGHAAPYGVKWFELGNESVHGNHKVIPHRQFTAEQYAAYANATAAAMRKVDPSIKIGIVMVPGAGTDVENEWNRTVIHLAGGSADFIVVHLYAPSAQGPSSVLMQSSMAVTEQTEHHLEEFREMARRESGRDISLAVTEYNGHLGDSTLPYRFSYGSALESADLIRIFLKPENHVLTANYWQFLNGYFGMLHTPKGSPTGEPQQEMPAFPLYRLWGQHFGTQLVSDEVQGPRTTFAGIGSVRSAGGSIFRERRMLQQMKIGFSSLPLLSFHASLGGSPDNFVIHWNGQTGQAYPTLTTLHGLQARNSEPIEYDIHFQARFVPAPGSDSANLGLGLSDARGWNATHSGIGVDGIGQAWGDYSGTYSALSTTNDLNLTARMQAMEKGVSGDLEIRSLSVTAYAPASYPAYALLTSSASISADGQKLYLIVFNKSENDAISTTIHVTQFHAAESRIWEVNGPQLTASSDVQETKHGDMLPIDGQGLILHTFPAHSMTAIEFTRSRNR
jgi:alpha-N-arabinofuranosidase